MRTCRCKANIKRKRVLRFLDWSHMYISAPTFASLITISLIQFYTSVVVKRMWMFKITNHNVQYFIKYTLHIFIVKWYEFSVIFSMFSWERYRFLVRNFPFMIADLSICSNNDTGYFFSYVLMNVTKPEKKMTMMSFSVCPRLFVGFVSAKTVNIGWERAVLITFTSPCNSDPCKPHFYIVKPGYLFHHYHVNGILF